MYLQHFGLRHAPLGKELTEPRDDGTLAHLTQRFNWLLQSPGIGLITGEPGVGKTAALRSVTSTLNPHRYLVLYQAEPNTDCRLRAVRILRIMTETRPGAHYIVKAKHLRNGHRTGTK